VSIVDKLFFLEGASKSMQVIEELIRKKFVAQSAAQQTYPLSQGIIYMNRGLFRASTRRRLEPKP